MAIAHLPRSWVLPTLERETSALHADAEADLFRILDDPTTAAYGRFLTRVFHFEAEAESQLLRVEGLPCELVAARLKTNRLAADLLALEPACYVRTILARPLELPPLRDPRDALGWLYVLERNTLRHLDLFRALAPRLRATLQIASRYLTTHSRDVYQRWHELGACLDRYAYDEHELTRIVDAATDAFDRQHRWYC